MNGIHLLAVGDVPQELLEDLRARMARHWQLACSILPASLDPSFAWHAQRQQFHSTQILARMEGVLQPGIWRVVGVTMADLFVPVLTFVFGEAQISGRCALVSAHRLRQEFFGLPADPDLFQERLLKEAVHELGHTLSLTHCDNHQCVMAASHAVEWIDLKSASFCPACSPLAAAEMQAAASPLAHPW